MDPTTEKDILKQRILRLENQNMAIASVLSQAIGLLAEIALNLAEYQIQKRCRQLIDQLSTLKPYKER